MYLMAANPWIHEEFGTIPKRVFYKEYEQDLYLYKCVFSTKPLVDLFTDEDSGYFVYHK